MIFFDEPSHTYRLDNPIDGQECISVTTLIGLFKSEFNEKYWSYYHALRKLRGEEKPQYKKFLWRVGYKSGEEQNKPEQEYKEKLNELALSCGYFPTDMELAQQEVLYEWKKKNKNAQVKGTNFHNYQESSSIKNGGMEYENIHVNLATQTEDLANLCHPTDTVYIPELRMYNREYLISGTSDVNYFFPNKQFDIDDYKTSETIDTENKYQNMQYPLQHLQDCNYNHYRLQVSIYAWMLKQWGYTPRNLKFTHVELEEDGLTVKKSTHYHTSYLELEVENMLNYYRNNKQMLLAKYKK